MAQATAAPKSLPRRRFDISLWGVYTVWFRQFHAYRKTWLVNCLPSLTEPMVYLLAFGFGLGPVIGKVSYHGIAIDYLSFLAPGMICVAVVSQSYFEGAYGVYVRIRYEKSWQALLTGPVTFEDIFCGEILWASTKGMIGSAATAIVARGFGIYPLEAFFFALPWLICGCILFSALGVLTAGVMKSIDQVNVPTFLFIIPMIAVCGTYFPQDNMPALLRVATGLMPLSALNELLRSYLVPATFAGANLALLLIWTAIAVSFAFYAIRKRVLL